MIVNAYGTEMQDMLRIVMVSEKPKQNRDNLRRAREHLHGIVAEENLALYRRLGLHVTQDKGVMDSLWSYYWERAKKATRKHFGYGLIADIPWEDVPKVNDWCIEWINDHLTEARTPVWKQRYLGKKREWPYGRSAEHG